MKKLKLLILLALIVVFSSCYKWEVIITLKDIPQNKIDELLNAKTEIALENEKYILNSGLKKIGSRESKPSVKTYFFIDIRESKERDHENKTFFNKFKIVDFYVINKNRDFYFETQDIREVTIDEDLSYYIINSMPSNYVQDRSEIMVVKLQDASNKTYLLKTKAPDLPPAHKDISFKDND